MAIHVEGDTVKSECEAVALLSCHLFYKKPQLVVWSSRSSLERPHGTTASQNILSQVEGDQFVSRLFSFYLSFINSNQGQQKVLKLDSVDGCVTL